VKDMPAKPSEDKPVAPVEPAVVEPLVIDLTPLNEIIAEVRAYRDFISQVNGTTPQDMEKVNSWHGKMLAYLTYLTALER
jgi:hypothetical protein